MMRKCGEPPNKVEHIRPCPSQPTVRITTTTTMAPIQTVRPFELDYASCTHKQPQQWTRLIRFVAAETSQVHLGQPVDPKLDGNSLSFFRPA